MKLEMKEVLADYFDATFVIMHGENEMPGSAQLIHCLPEDPGQMKINFMGKTYVMTYPGAPQSRIKGYDPAYRHVITLDDAEVGEISHISAGGFLSKYRYMQLVFENEAFTGYEVHLGEEGSVYPVWHGDVLVAQARIGAKIFDGLYNYQIAALDEKAALAALLCCCYQYYAFAFIPGKERKASFDRSVGTTRNKTVLAKYDPAFEGKVEA